MAATRAFGAVRMFSTTPAAQAKLVKAPIQLFGVTGRYAHALYSAASKEKQLDLVEKELNKVQGLLQTDLKFAEFCENPTIKRVQKTDILTGVLTKQKLSKTTVNMFAAMAENGRLGSVNGILKAFAQIMAAHRGEVICTVTTAKPLDAKAAKELDTVLRAFLKKDESLLLETRVDPALIGGMQVSIGDKYIDMSMARKIDTYTKLIKAAI